MSIPGTVSSDFATRGARTEHLFSKLIAGGLSAGVVLLWWPHFFPHDSAGTWVARGIAWTLLAEILVVAVSPLEHALRARIAAFRPVGHARSFFTASSRLRANFALALAAIAVSLPLMLIATGHPAVAERPKPQRVTKVTRVVKVVKQVKVKRIVVREAAPAAPVYPPAVTPAPVVTSAPAATKPAATKRTAPAKRRQQPAAKDKPATPTPTPTPTTTPATPTPAPGA
jgi:hypothetical protein